MKTLKRVYMGRVGEIVQQIKPGKHEGLTSDPLPTLKSPTLLGESVTPAQGVEAGRDKEFLEACWPATLTK